MNRSLHHIVEAAFTHVLSQLDLVSDPPGTSPTSSSDGLCATVTLEGRWSGRLLLDISEAAAESLCHGLFDTRGGVGEVQPDDLVCEFANLVAQSARTLTLQEGLDMEVGLPSAEPSGVACDAEELFSVRVGDGVISARFEDLSTD